MLLLLLLLLSWLVLLLLLKSSDIPEEAASALTGVRIRGMVEMGVLCVLELWWEEWAWVLVRWVWEISIEGWGGYKAFVASLRTSYTSQASTRAGARQQYTWMLALPSHGVSSLRSGAVETKWMHQLADKTQILQSTAFRLTHHPPPHTYTGRPRHAARRRRRGGEEEGEAQCVMGEACRSSPAWTET